jgi:hypothetical protein
MVALITLAEATAHLNIDLAGDDGSSPTNITDERYPELLNKMEEASAIIIDYLKRDDIDWTPEQPPSGVSSLEFFVVKSAIKLVLKDLWDSRGGNDGGEFIAENGAVARLLRRFRDPAIA